MIDNEFETDDFERMLREHADRFFLTPSERVWRSIYNDLHPGSKWPSLAVGLFMVLTLFWVGNTNNDSPSFVLSSPQKMPVADIPEKVQSPVIRLSDVDFDKAVDGNDVRDAGAVQRTSGLFGNETAILEDATKEGKIIALVPKAGRNAFENLNPVDNAQVVISQAAESGRPQVSVSEVTAVQTEAIAPANTRLKGKVVAIYEKRPEKDMSVVSVDRQKIKIRESFRKKLKWEYFFSPMVSNVKFGGTNLNKSGTSVVLTPMSRHNMDIAKRLGFITGTDAYYPLTERFSIMTGAHIIYTGYDIYSEAIMPSLASLTFKDSKGKLFSKNYISYYANDKSGNSYSITNYNWQFSVPVGVQWDFVKNNRFTISVMSSVEPFMVLGSNAYLLSGDASNYVTDPDLIRKFNLSSNIGSAISFDGKLVNWKIGPNFRYQILSTYNNIYPVKEHFVNYGIHVGVTKKK